MSFLIEIDFYKRLGPLPPFLLFCSFLLIVLRRKRPQKKAAFLFGEGVVLALFLLLLSFFGAYLLNGYAGKFSLSFLMLGIWLAFFVKHDDSEKKKVLPYTFFLAAALKWDCFLRGCCFGIAGHFFGGSVRYWSQDFHSAFGQELFPIQALEASVFLLLGLFSKKERVSKTLLSHRGLNFLLLFFSARFLLGFFKAQHFYQSPLGLLHATQVESLVFVSLYALCWGAVLWAESLRGYSFRRTTLKLPLLISLGVLSACHYPDPPKSVARIKFVAPTGHTVFQMGLPLKKTHKGPPRFQRRLSDRNAVIVIADSLTDAQGWSDLGRIRMEQSLAELLWNYSARDLAAIYEKVFLLSGDRVTKPALLEVLKTAQRERKDFDLYLVTHGFHNHLVLSKDEFFSYKDLGVLGQIKGLNLVYLQACYSSSLARDFLSAGAKVVLSYKGLNNNVVWLPSLWDSTAFTRRLRYIDEPEYARERFEGMVKRPHYQWLLPKLARILKGPFSQRGLHSDQLSASGIVLPQVSRRHRQ